MSNPSNSVNEGNPGRMYEPIDKLFVLFVVLEIIAWPILPGLPLVVALAAMTTRVRTSKWRSVFLWTLAGFITLIVIAPFIIGMFNLNITNESPGVPASPAP